MKEIAKDHFCAANVFLNAAVKFRNETKFSPEKANEIYSAFIVNTWLKANGYKWQLKINTAPRGIDGEIVGTHDFGTRTSVEFKSSKQKSPSFQFKEGFAFSDHGCIVMTEFEDGTARRIFFAIGEETCLELARRLNSDKDRDSYNPSRDLLRLFSKTQEVSKKGRRTIAYGLKDVPIKFSDIDKLVCLEGDQLQKIIEKINNN